MRSCVLILALLLPSPPASSAEKTIPEKLQMLSVTIRAGRSQGSGVMVLRGDTNYVLTAGHVIANVRHRDGSPEQPRILFDDVDVVQDVVEEGRKVGTRSFTATVVSYSPADKPGEDLAILKLHKRRAFTESTIFLISPSIPPIGTSLFHVGSLLGQLGSNSMTTGIVSQVGRVVEDTVYDQTSCTAFPGSSGGGVFTTDGIYVGMIVRGAGEGFNLTVPVRRIAAWTKRVKAEFILDPSLPTTPITLEEVPPHADHYRSPR